MNKISWNLLGSICILCWNTYSISCRSIHPNTHFSGLKPAHFGENWKWYDLCRSRPCFKEQMPMVMPNGTIAKLVTTCDIQTYHYLVYRKYLQLVEFVKHQTRHNWGAPPYTWSRCLSDASDRSIGNFTSSFIRVRSRQLLVIAIWGLVLKRHKHIHIYIYIYNIYINEYSNNSNYQLYWVKWYQRSEQISNSGSLKL